MGQRDGDYGVDQSECLYGSFERNVFIHFSWRRNTTIYGGYAGGNLMETSQIIIDGQPKLLYLGGNEVANTGLSFNIPRTTEL